MFYTATYQNYWGIKTYSEYPIVFESLKIDEGHLVDFFLADETEVRLINPPNPELIRAEGRWGEFRKKLHSSVVGPVDFTLEIIGSERYCWLCIPSLIVDGVGELQYKISRRNRQIEDLRKRNQNLREKLTALSVIK